MPIKPIDLQTLFSQVDRVGREQSAGKEGAALQGAARADAAQKRAEERARAVQRSADSDDAASKGVNPDGRGKAGKSASEGKEGDEEGEKEKAAESEEEVIRDPELGTKIDLSG
jgi:hypothetical protein